MKAARLPWGDLAVEEEIGTCTYCAALVVMSDDWQCIAKRSRGHPARVVAHTHCAWQAEMRYWIARDLATHHRVRHRRRERTAGPLRVIK